uniref:Uncharacterized protein n=1 Tax=Neogobius melanostomus TaxID=47308 RepID=A0A8C6SE37_9GOBI
MSNTKDKPKTTVFLWKTLIAGIRAIYEKVCHESHAACLDYILYVQQRVVHSGDRCTLTPRVCFVLMPRKKIQIEKHPLRFLERPAGEARVHHNVPEVRAALNPKDFFTEAHGHNGSALNSWVKPQFDTSAAAPVKRKKGKLSASVQGNFSQLSRARSVCSNRFPTLLFQTKKDHHQKQRKKVLDNRISSASNGQGFSQKAKIGTTEKGLLQNDNIISRYGNSKKATSLCQTGGNSCIPTEAPSSHAPNDCAPVDIASPLPHLVLAQIEDYSSTFSKPLHLLWSPPCTPSTTDILVPDTPERDYGVKVTWRHRKKLMQLLKAKGHLSDPEEVTNVSI